MYHGRMQRILSVARTFTSLIHLQSKLSIQQSLFSTFQKPGVNERLLTPFNPVIYSSCGFKVKGHLYNHASPLEGSGTSELTKLKQYK
ncbi:Dehydratase [Operophtera brumata]|uniref:Dehydratase n=1 Tax=Operophtera brumata TaxID=104452 RepID=A0A0L7LHU3_OPEBR|nr:Dehydratase [Operophtera brumata]